MTTLFFHDIIILHYKKEKKMENKRSSKNIRILIILTFLIFLIGILIGIFHKETINKKMAEMTTAEEPVEIANTIDSETIIAAYTPRREVASEEVVSRYAKARERAMYNSVDEIKISKNMDLTVRCNVSRDDFIALIAGVRADTSGFFEKNAGTIYDLCEKYQINEIFFCGLISAESGWTIADNHRRTHNYISLMGSGGALLQFATVEIGLEKAANTLHTNYLSERGRFYYGKTLEAVRTRFCPVNPGWTNLVYGRMQQII